MQKVERRRRICSRQDGQAESQDRRGSDSSLEIIVVYSFHLFLSLNMFFQVVFFFFFCFKLLLVSCSSTVAACALLLTLISPHLSLIFAGFLFVFVSVLLVIRRCYVVDIVSDSHAPCQQVCLFRLYKTQTIKCSSCVEYFSTVGSIMEFTGHIIHFENSIKAISIQQCFILWGNNGWQCYKKGKIVGP